MRGNTDFVFMVITMSDIKKYIMIDIVAGAACYYAILLPFHSTLASMAGSMFAPMLIRRSLRPSIPQPNKKSFMRIKSRK